MTVRTAHEWRADEPLVRLVGDELEVPCVDGVDRPYLSLDAAASTAPAVVAALDGHPTPQLLAITGATNVTAWMPPLDAIVEPYRHDPHTGDYWPEVASGPWSAGDRILGASCARG